MDLYAIVQRWGWWYTIGFCHLRQALRWFRLDRIVSLELLPDVFVRPPDFDVTMQMSEAEPQPAVHICMRFLPPAAALARYNRGYWASLAEEADGAVVVTFTAADQEWATSTVLAYGPLVEVLEPAAVRQLVAEWAAAVVARYADR